MSNNDYNQTNILPDMNSNSSSDDDDNEREGSFFMSHYTALVITLVLGSFVLLVVSFWLREVCYDRFGIEVCVGSISTARRREIRRFQLRALQLQRQMERDLQESSVSKQQERKEVYGAFLQKFGKVRIHCSIFVWRMENYLLWYCSTYLSLSFQVLVQTDFTEEEMDEVDDSSAEPQRYLRLCTHDPCREQVVEAVCIICFKDYEVGEQVTWSSSSQACRHVYHKDCILKWISTGKKKCPVCRYAFVPDLSRGAVQQDTTTPPTAGSNETLPRDQDAV